MVFSKKLIFVATIFACCAPFSVYAADESGKTIQVVGTQAGGYSYVVFNEALTTTCAYNSIYLPDSSTIDAKNMLAVLLTAENTSKPVRVVYSLAANGTCIASLIAS